MVKTKKSRLEVLKTISKVAQEVLYWVLMGMLVAAMIFLLTTNRNKPLTKIFGDVYVRISSTSMESSGFKVGDIVCIRETSVAELKTGDIIAFYLCRETADESKMTSDMSGAIDFKTNARNKSSIIIFHKIANVRCDSDGNVWVKTYGTSNIDGQGHFIYDSYTRGDYIIGKYQDTKLAGVIQFLTSPRFIFYAIIVPCALVLFLLLIEIIRTIDQLLSEKKAREMQRDLILQYMAKSISRRKKLRASATAGGEGDTQNIKTMENTSEEHKKSTNSSEISKNVRSENKKSSKTEKKSAKIERKEAKKQEKTKKK